jgi:hypothetical protein
MPERRAADFQALQGRLRDLWPLLRLGPIGDVERTVVVVHSINFDMPDHVYPVFPAYEERYLAIVLSLLRAPRSRVVYVTSQPVLPRLVDYFFDLVPELDGADARRRLDIVTLVDASARPLTEKLLERPGAVERIRRCIVDPSLAFFFPFSTTEHEVELALRLGIPMYGCDPALGLWGTKQGSRRLFEEEDVPHPVGVDVRGTADLVPALEEIRGRRPGVREVIVKIDRGVSGLGNAVIDVSGAESRADLAACAASLQLEDEEQDVNEYAAGLDKQGGIVEERIQGPDYRSPSVQLRLTPDGTADVLSTHDQILGGRYGMSYLGARMPADPAYAARLAEEGAKIGRRLAREGATGRAAVDFVAVKGQDTWLPYALEVNLRAGGTTHPLIALEALTDGQYDQERGEFVGEDGVAKHYVATDHLESPAYRALTPDDLLDLVHVRGLGWDNERKTGVVLHMVSALAAAGRVGLTAIGNSPSECDWLYERVERTLDEASART